MSQRKLTKLTSLDQLQVGTRLKIVASNEKDCYQCISVKKLIKMWNEHGDGSLLSCGPKDTEILINRKKNYYFSMNAYLKGTSWVKEIYVLSGLDKRLKAVKNA
jgi:hypothetical protein